MTIIRIGSRGSRLAMAQSLMIRDMLREIDPGLDITIKTIRTTGDRFMEASPKELASLTRGIFVKEIEEALIEGSIDLAVHSLKDLPVETPAGLRISAIPAREDPRDVLVSGHPLNSVTELPENARIATSSPRRSEQLRLLRPDLRIVPLRGNVDTRIGKLKNEGLDAVVLAAAGLKRLKLGGKITCYLDPAQVVPAPGQGCLAIETAEEIPPGLEEMLSRIDDPQTREAAGAERKFQMSAGEGCNFPLGAYARVGGSMVSFFYYLGYPETGRHLSGTLSGVQGEIEKIADKAIEEVIKAGAG